MREERGQERIPAARRRAISAFSFVIVSLLSTVLAWFPVQTSSDRLCLAAARFSTRRSLSVFCAGFLPSFFGFCEPFTASLPVGVLSTPPWRRAPAPPRRPDVGVAGRQAGKATPEGEMPKVERPVPTRVLDRPGHRLAPDCRSRGITCTAGCTQARCGSRGGGAQSLGGVRPRSTRPAIGAPITTAHPPP